MVAKNELPQNLVELKLFFFLFFCFGFFVTSSISAERAGLTGEGEYSGGDACGECVSECESM